MDLEILTLSLVTFFDSNHITLKAYLYDTIYGNEQCWSKINPTKACLSQTRGKNHKDWLYSRFWNFYFRSCNFFDSYQITLKALLDDTIYGNEQCWKKKLSKRCVCLRPKGKTIRIDFFVVLEILTLSLVTFLLVIIKLSKHI